MKRILLEILFVISVFACAFGIALIIFSFMDNNLLYNYWVSDESNYIKYPLDLLIISFWIYLIVIWNRYDKRVGRLVLLLILNVYFMPFYYRIATKKGWISRKK